MDIVQMLNVLVSKTSRKNSGKESDDVSMTNKVKTIQDCLISSWKHHTHHLFLCRYSTS